jgi:hypothetical protein
MILHMCRGVRASENRVRASENQGGVVFANQVFECGRKSSFGQHPSGNNGGSSVFDSYGPMIQEYL